MTQYVTVGYGVDEDRYRVEVYTDGDLTADEVLDTSDGEESTARALAAEVAAERGLPVRDPAARFHNGGLVSRVRYDFAVLRNYTRHQVDLVAGDGTVTTLDPEPAPVRIEVTTQEHGRAYGVPVVKEATERIRGLPAPEEGVWIIVSRRVADYCMQRPQYSRWDLLIPGDQVHDDTGRVIGCRSLVMVCC